MKFTVTGLANAYITAKMASIKKIIKFGSRETCLYNLRDFINKHPYYQKMMNKSDYTEDTLVNKIYGN